MACSLNAWMSDGGDVTKEGRGIPMVQASKTKLQLKFDEEAECASIASLFLTTEALVTDLPEEKLAATPPMPHGDMY